MMAPLGGQGMAQQAAARSLASMTGALALAGAAMGTMAAAAGAIFRGPRAKWACDVGPKDWSPRTGVCGCRKGAR